jgi:hypothetical protein
MDERLLRARGQCQANQDDGAHEGDDDGADHDGHAMSL